MVYVRFFKNIDFSTKTKKKNTSHKYKNQLFLIKSQKKLNLIHVNIRDFIHLHIIKTLTNSKQK